MLNLKLQLLINFTVCADFSQLTSKIINNNKTYTNEKMFKEYINEILNKTVTD